ncbi:MAG: hypothetical protein ACI9MR_001058, partial [Myxococcota bacterium]
NLDVWRTAYFLGLLQGHSQTRVIGVDGQVGPLVDSAIAQLCSDGWLTGSQCASGQVITYETTDTGRGWFRFHHHHLHISLSTSTSGGPQLPASMLCKTPGCPQVTEPAAHACQVDDTELRKQGRD